MTRATAPADTPRLQLIERARQAVLAGAPEPGTLAPWIERSWRRCLEQGRQPHEPVSFDPVPAQARARARDAHQALLQAAQPVLARLARAIAGSRYFALLTDAQGMVIAADGPIDSRDRRATLISRIGVDLSECAVGTTAIGAALLEQQPVWLHRGEHFFQDTACYSCAGAPLWDPDGDCVGMLDVTGIDAAERPELRHLVGQAVRSIENALVQARTHALLLRMNWPGQPLGLEGDALVALDADGQVVAANAAARQMAAVLATTPGPLHASDLFALPWEQLFDGARHEAPQELPLWSGLTASVLARRAGSVPADSPIHVSPSAPAVAAGPLDAQGRPLRDLETDLIRRTVRQARGNVMEAARLLGISRATIYRRLRSPAK